MLIDFLGKASFGSCWPHYRDLQFPCGDQRGKAAALMYKRSRLVRVRGSHGRLTFGINGEAEVVSGRG
ncbi:GTP-binding protein [Dendrobium catenatum]|uniref:GTP-binding protein n=1 Tax=Dendrobium catenatum TaxID=906689 RepID=A0A2I0V843_9ASPA|nr:GTP-binding protein [Dendrobium catenatum]